MEPLAVDVPEAARLLAQSEKTIRRWIAAGLLPSVKRGRSRRIRMDDLRAFNARHDEANVTPLAPVQRRKTARRPAYVDPLPAYDGPMPLEDMARREGWQ